MISPASTLTEDDVTAPGAATGSSAPASGSGAASTGRPGYTSLDVRLDGVGRSFGEHTVLRDVSLTVAPGEVLAILGSSAAGSRLCCAPSEVSTPAAPVRS